jgi:hypothetical protein
VQHLPGDQAASHPFSDASGSQGDKQYDSTKQPLGMAPDVLQCGDSSVRQRQRRPPRLDALFQYHTLHRNLVYQALTPLR